MKTCTARLCGAGLLAAALAGPAQALPDLGRGLKALENGDVKTAEADLEPLARDGYIEAQLALARHYAELDTPQALDKAAHWYRAASRRDPSRRSALGRVLLRIGTPAAIKETDELLRKADAEHDPEALRLRLRLYREYPPTQLTQADVAALAQRAAGSRVRDDRAEAIAWYRSAAATDTQYVAPLLKLCDEARSWLPECYADLLRQRRGDSADARATLLKDVEQKYRSKLIGPELLERIARALLAEDPPGEPLPAEAYPLLKLAARQQATAEARLGKLLLEHSTLDAQADPVAMLKHAYDKGASEASLTLGRCYLEGLTVIADPVEAQRWLERAQKDYVAAHFYLGRLYERGYLGQADPQRALDHLLQAARGGYARADLSIAQMYAKNRGVKVDTVAAYAFAKLAQAAGVTGAEDFLVPLRDTLDTAARRKGEAMANAELAARQTINTQTLARLPTDEKNP